MAFTIWSISWSADGDSIFEVLDLLRGLSSRVIMNFQHLEGTRLVQECGVVNGFKTLVHITGLELHLGQQKRLGIQ